MFKLLSFTFICTIATESVYVFVVQIDVCTSSVTKCLFIYLFIYFVEKVHMKETKQMTLQLDRKVHDSL